MGSLGIQSGASTAYHPQTDGQTERMNQVVEDYLRHFCSYYQDDWSKSLDMAEFSINNLDSASLKISPFFFTYGFHPKFNIITESTGRKDLDEFLMDLQITQETAIECLTQAWIKQAHYYNQGKNDSPVYAEGDRVLLLRKFIQTRRLNSKLDYRYIGPFRVIKMVGKNAAELDIQHDYPKLHPVFNVSLLVRYHDPMIVNDRGLVCGSKANYYSDDQVVDWSKVRGILDERILSKGKVDYLVAWKSATVGENTWISDKHIPKSASTFIETFKKNYEAKYKKKKKKALEKLGQSEEIGKPIL
jgi:hypothetical protein